MAGTNSAVHFRSSTLTETMPCEKHSLLPEKFQRYTPVFLASICTQTMSTSVPTPFKSPPEAPTSGNGKGKAKASIVNGSPEFPPDFPSTFFDTFSEVLPEAFPEAILEGFPEESSETFPQEFAQEFPHGLTQAIDQKPNLPMHSTFDICTHPNLAKSLVGWVSSPDVKSEYNNVASITFCKDEGNGVLQPLLHIVKGNGVDSIQTARVDVPIQDTTTPWRFLYITGYETFTEFHVLNVVH
jgi:hypothetical protein